MEKAWFLYSFSGCGGKKRNGFPRHRARWLGMTGAGTAPLQHNPYYVAFAVSDWERYFLYHQTHSFQQRNVFLLRGGDIDACGLYAAVTENVR